MEIELGTRMVSAGVAGVCSADQIGNLNLGVIQRRGE